MKLTPSFRDQNVAQAQKSSMVLFLASVSSVVCSLGGSPVFWINPSAGDGQTNGWMDEQMDRWMDGLSQMSDGGLYFSVCSSSHQPSLFLTGISFGITFKRNYLASTPHFGT